MEAEAQLFTSLSYFPLGVSAVYKSPRDVIDCPAAALLVYGHRVHRVDQRRAAAIIFQLITSCNCLGTSGTRPHAHSQQPPPQVFPLKNDRKKEKEMNAES